MTLRVRVFEVLDYAAGDPGVISVGGDARSAAGFLKNYAAVNLGLDLPPVEALAPHCAAWLDDGGRPVPCRRVQ